jgi:tRNA G10  N-methylase Trm11
MLTPQGPKIGERPYRARIQRSREELLYQCLDEAGRRLAVGGVLYLTVPAWLDGEPVVAALRARFSRIGPLNVGSNPRLQNNDVHTCSGYLCVK